MFRIFSQIVVLVIVIIPNFSLAQFVVSGIPGLHYVDIIPDTIIDPMIGNNGSHYPPDKLFEFDMNQDGINDIKILCHAHLGNGSAANTVFVSCLNASFTIAYGNTDSTYNNFLAYWVKRDMLKQFSYNDTVYRNNFVPVTSGYLAFYLGQTGSYASSSQWVNMGDKFFGVRYVSSIDTLYGWVKVNLNSQNNCTIKEYSLGDINTWIDEFSELNALLITPNPADDKVYIKSDFIEEKGVKCKMYDFAGKIIYESQNLKNPIHVSGLSNGIYFMCFETINKVVVKKVIVSH